MGRWIWLPALLCVIFVVAAQQAGYAGEVEKGFGWLRSQVQVDGSVAGEDSSQALPVQVRTEVLHTLTLFESQQAGLADRVDAEQQKHTELQARKALALRLAGRGAQQVIADLGLQQNADGGFGSRQTYTSNALDTAYALIALSSIPDADPARVVAALTYLRTARLSQAGWSVGDHPSIYATSAVLLAAQGWSSRYQVGDIVAAARDWLLAQRGADNTYGNVLDNANSLLALTTQTSDEGILQPLSTALKQAQLESGSWDNDPYTTAIALRALYRASIGMPPTTTGAIAGVVVESGTGTPLAGVTLTVRESPETRVETAADGGFMLLGLNPGQHTVDIQAIGYVSRSFVATVTTGVTTNTGTIALDKTALTAEVFGIVRNSSGTPLAGVVVSSSTASAFTASDGSYSLKGLNAGSATVTFALGNYRTLEVPLILEPGKRYQLSPALYTNSQTPPANATILGTVIDQATAKVLPGATIKVGTVTTTSATNGTFQIANLNAGSYPITISAAGYTTLQGTVSLVDGNNNVGKIALTKAPATSTLTGLVTNAESGLPVAGAVLVVQGQAATTAAGPDGRYLLSGIQGTTFTVIISGQGYTSRTISVTLPAIGQSELNVELLPISDSKIVFESVSTHRPVYRPSDEVELEIEVRNGGDTSADLVIDAEVLDPEGNVVYVFKANARGLGQNPPNQPLRFEAGTLTEVETDWVLVRQAAGVYTVVARGRDVAGNVRAEGTTRFTVDAMPILAGAVVTDPPLTQVDSDRPVSIKAEMTNLGNQPIPAGMADLKITLAAASNETGSTRSTVEQVAAFANQKMVHLDRDGAGNFYTTVAGRINKIAPDGTQSILATFADWTAIGGLTVQGDGIAWACSGNTLRKVASDGGVQTFPLVSISACRSLDVNGSGDLLLGGSSALANAQFDEQILVKYRAGAGESVLWRGGLAQAMGMARLSGGGFAITNKGDGTVYKVSDSGIVTPFVAGLNQPFDIVELPGGDLLVANSGANNLIRIAPNGDKSVFASGLNQPFGLLVRNDGSLLVSNQGNNTIVAIDADGQVSPFAEGFAHLPTGIAVDGNGAIVVANSGDGTLKSLRDGRVSSITTGLGSTGALVIDSQGNKYVADVAGAIHRIALDGTKTLVGTGFGSIGGLALQGDGVLHVTDKGARRIVHLNLDTDTRQVTESMLVSPTRIRTGAAGQAYFVNTGFISIRRADGSVARLMATSNLSAMDAMPEGGIVVLNANRDVVLIGDDGVSGIARNLPYHVYGMSARGPGKVALVRYNNRYELEELDMATGARRVIVALSTNPTMLGGDRFGNVYYKVGSELHRVDPTGVDARISYAINGESMDDLAVDPDGRVLVRTTANNVWEIDPSGASVKLFGGLTAIGGIGRDASGTLFTSHTSEHRVLLRNSAGTAVGSIDGFSNPVGVAWTGSALRFLDDAYRLYTLDAPGGAPQRLAVNFYGKALAHDASRDGTFAVGYSNLVLEWRAGATTQHSTSLPGGNYTGVATLGNGRLALSERDGSVVYISQLAQLQQKIGGLLQPRGLANAADGGVLVANFAGGMVLKLASAGALGESVHTVASPNFVQVAADGAMWVSTSGALRRVATNGAVSTVPTLLSGNSTVSLNDLVVEGNTVHINDYNIGLVRSAVGGTPTLVAGGIGSVKSVAWSTTNQPLVLDGNSRAVYVVADGAMRQFHARVPRADVISMDTSGALFSAGRLANATRFADDELQTLDIAALLGDVPMTGLTATSDTQAYALVQDTSTSSAIQRITAPRTTTPPEVGQVVYTKSMPMPELTTQQELLTLDFGSWVPPYAGDFKLEVSINGVEGLLANFIHVGASALGTLSVQPEELPPGDQVANVRLDITGGDFTSLSRVEVARLRKEVDVMWPKGITSDRAGNIYFSTANALYKSGVDGVTTALATGLAIPFGLDIDSSERLYFLEANGAGRYDLVRSTLTGQMEVFAALNVSSASGVAIDGMDNVYVAMPGRLVRVNPQGQVSTVATAGFPSPRGITIDGKGNIYVQNENNLVAQVFPDGAVQELYKGGDGVDNPAFEGDGFPNITADCSDNLYIATSQWSKVNQYGEEHTIAQIVSRTGHVGLLVDTSRTVPRLTDIDYLAFDRFNQRLLLWDHYAPGIHSIPVTCGAISVDAHLFSLPGQTLSGFTVPPSATIAHADGRTEYVWSLRDVTAQGVSIDFGAPLQGLALGESRATLDSAYLAFQNTFTQGEYRVPLAIPNVSVANVVDIAVTTDKPEYAASEDVAITVQLDNTHSGAVSGTLVVDILDADGVVVDEVYRDDVMLGAAAALTVPATYNVGSILPAGYTARARLLNSTLNTAEDSTGFAVLASQGEALAEATLALDKAAYDPTDRVGITSTVHNRSANINLDGLLLMVRVYDHAGTLQYTGGHEVGTLLHGTARSFQAGQVLNNAAPGSYRVQQLLQDADGRIYDTDEATYVVNSTATTGAGVGGQIAAVPTVATVGESILLDALAVNTGNADLGSGELVIRVLDPANEAVLQTWEQAASIAVGGQQAFKPTWSSAGAIAGDYAATLSLRLGDEERLLASTTFQLTALSVKLSLRQQLAAGRNLLVLASCQPGDQGQDPACAAHKAQRIDTLLTAIGIPHVIADSVDEFRFLMRGGEFDAYWISGGSDHLGHLLANELLEAVFRGDGLIVDGDHDSRNGLLNDALGVKYQGKLPNRQHTVTMIDTQVFDAGQFDISDRSIRFTPVGATAHGRFTNGDAAVLTHAYGTGRSTTFSFDLVASIEQSTSAPFMEQVLSAGINHVLADDTGGYAAGQLFGVLTTVGNLAAPTDAWLQLFADAPLSIDGTAPVAGVAGLHDASWRFYLEAAQEREFMTWVRAPDVDGSYVVRAITGYGPAVGVNALANVETGVDVISSTTLQTQLHDALSSLQPLRSHERNAKDEVIAQVHQAQAYAASNQYSSAIETLVRARTILTNITTIDVAPARLALSRYLGYVERKSTQH
ncbi:MAG TPA: carboxypeptidase regulatory-like domain-containing protein [Lysobacter sp.]